MTTVIISGGNIDKDFSRGFIETLHESSLFIIACDHGYENCELIGVTPDLVVGDFDSASPGTFENIVAAGIDVIKLNPVKDDTDTEAALDVAIAKTTKSDDIYLLGATGTRLDHVMGNIALVGKGLKQGRKVHLVDSHNYIDMLQAGETLTIDEATKFGTYVSVFPYMSSVKGLNMEGFKYPVVDADIYGFNTLTVSNELIAEKGFISIREGYLVVMQTRD